jgi:hypothetical protein
MTDRRLAAYGNNTYSLADANEWWSKAAVVTDLPNA